MNRTFGVPAAVVALVVVPVIVLAAQPKKAAPPPPDPKQAALTIRLAGAEGSSGHPAFVRLTAVGKPPAKSKTFTLADDTGLHSAKVVVADLSGKPCANATIRATGLEGEANAQVWCLRIRHADVGAELKGTVSVADAGTKPSTVLALTVTRRNAFCVLPLAFLVLGLLAGLGVILVPRALSLLVKRVVLSSLVEENEAAAPSARLAGLADWVRARVAAGATDADTAAAIAPVIKQGPAAAAGARAKLQRAIDASGIPLTQPLIAAAIKQAEQKTNDISDFLDDAAKPVPHPATVLLAAVQTLTEAGTVLANAQQRIANLAQPCQADLTVELAAARITFGGIAGPDDIPHLEERLNALRTAIDDAEAKPECARVNVAGAGVAASLELAPQGVLPPLITGPGLSVVSGAAKLACGFVILVIAVFAGVTVWLSAYSPNFTFSSPSDYFLLFTTALGSGAAAGVLSVLGWWQATSAPADS
jgi:hypothetical protein